MSKNSGEGPWRVLCVDDDDGVLRLYQAIFRRAEWDPMFCSSGEQALDHLQKTFFDLIILDVVMPGLGGMDICALLREQPADEKKPVIFMVSGVGNEEAIEQGFSTGADDYLVKPFQPNELLAKAKRSLRAIGQQTNTTGLQAKTDVGLGSVFADRYQIEDRVAAGGYSVVFRAFDPISNRTVAVKLYDLPLAARTGQVVAGFLREAYQLSRIRHPNVVELYDFGQAQGFFYMAMEHIDGYSLDQTVKKRGPLSVPALALVCYEVVQALADLATHGIVHRDVKPANIMISRSGDTKIIDFGLARNPSEGTLSLADEFQGTPQFVPPEMIRGSNELDERSDLYSLGATLYYAATGVAPFRGESNFDILNSHLNHIPPPVIDLRPDFDVEFSNLIDEMLAINLDARPNCIQVAETLANIFKFNHA